MKLSILALLTAFVSAVMSSPIAAHKRKPPYFLLTGDSTVASGGGWGDGLLSYLLVPAHGENHGKTGATTVSFRAQERWNAVINATSKYAAEYEPIVTVQFGHNDQKAEANITVEQFQENLERMGREVQAAGGTPIFVTSLTRRAFGADGKVIQNLEEQRERAIAAARAVGAQYLDLNRASTAYINAIGQENADSYNLADGDRTHLNTSGETVFGRMVVDLLIQKRRQLGRNFQPAGPLSRKIWSGEFATGTE